MKLIADEIKKIAQYLDTGPNMLLELLRGFLNDTKDDWNYILPTDLFDQIQAGKALDYLIIDVRKSEDYNKGHIKGAINIFWLDILKEENIKKLPIDKQIIVYCYVGHTSSQIMTLLKLLGYNCKSLKFGLGISPSEGVPVAGWIDYNYPLEK